MTGYFQIGYFRKTHGYKGDLVLRFETQDPALLAALDSFFLESESGPLPYFIHNIKSQKQDDWIVHIEDVDDELAAKRLVGKAVYIPEHLVPELPEDEYYLHELIGFDARDEDANKRMKVSDVIDRPNQPLLVLTDADGRDVMVPLVDAFVLNIDKANQLIELQVPEALYDIN